MTVLRPSRKVNLWFRGLKGDSLDSIDTSHIVILRDWVLIAFLVYLIARV